MSKRLLSVSLVVLAILGFSMKASNTLASGTKAYSIPTMSPLFGPPPYEYRDSWALNVLFKTELKVLKELVPEPLIPNPDGIMFARIMRHFASGLGGYNEFLLGAPVIFEGRLVNYCIYLMLDNDIAIASGREIWGFPKKFGRMNLSEKDGVVLGTVERGGITVVKAAMEINALAKPEEAAGTLEYVNLKVIPSVKQGAPPDVQQLTSTTLGNFNYHRLYKGKATLEFGVSPGDSFHRIAITSVLGGMYTNFDFTLTYGDIIHDYLK